jgi:hypothetical protein
MAKFKSENLQSGLARRAFPVGSMPSIDRGVRLVRAERFLAVLWSSACPIIHHPAIVAPTTDALLDGTTRRVLAPLRIGSVAVTGAEGFLLYKTMSPIWLNSHISECRPVTL